MAFTVRSIDAIFQDLLLEKQNLPELAGLIDGSVTDVPSLITSLENGTAAEWVMWLFNMAVATHLTEVSLSTGITDIDNLLAANRIPNERWYIEQVLAFQYGDTLVIDPVTYQVGYATINDGNKIVASCTTKLVDNTLYLKVRRTSSDILSGPELTALNYYISKVKAAGTRVLLENFEADLITLNMEIYYEGSATLSTIQSAVESAINDYLNNIRFDSKLIVNDLLNKLQSIANVIDPRVITASAIDSLSNVTTFTHEYRTNAGYSKINPATPLSTSITYIAQ